MVSLPSVFLSALCASIVSPMRVTLPLHGILPDVIILILFGDKKLHCFYLCGFLLVLLLLRILLNILFSNARVMYVYHFSKGYRPLPLPNTCNFLLFNVLIVITVLTIPLPRLLSAATESLPYHVRKPLLLRKIPFGRPRLT